MNKSNTNRKSFCLCWTDHGTLWLLLCHA